MFLIIPNITKFGERERERERESDDRRRESSGERLILSDVARRRDSDFSL